MTKCRLNGWNYQSKIELGESRKDDFTNIIRKYSIQSLSTNLFKAFFTMSWLLRICQIWQIWNVTFVMPVLTLKAQSWMLFRTVGIAFGRLIVQYASRTWICVIKVISKGRVQRKWFLSPLALTPPKLDHEMTATPRVILATTHLMFAQDQRGGLRCLQGPQGVPYTPTHPIPESSDFKGSWNMRF